MAFDLYNTFQDSLGYTIRRKFLGLAGLVIEPPGLVFLILFFLHRGHGFSFGT